MSKDLFQLCYEGECGENFIRSMNERGQLYVSLEDVIRTLSAENRKMENTTSARLTTLLNAVVTTLDSDEFKKVRVPGDGVTRDEIFLAEPGLYRVLAQDISPAGKKFQRWLFHKVLPSIREFGEYPPPNREGKSEIRHLANCLQETVNLVVMEIEKREELERRVDSVETKVNAIESLRDLSQFRTVSSRLLEMNMESDRFNIEELWQWCEKIRSETGAEKIACPSGVKTNNYYPIAVVDRAISVYQEVLSARNNK